MRNAALASAGADDRRQLQCRAVVQRLRDAQLLEQRVLLRDVHRLPPELGRVACAPVREQRAAYVLLSASASVKQRSQSRTSRLGLEDSMRLKEDCAPVAGDDVHERGLAGAAGAHDGREAAARELPTQPVQNALHLCKEFITYNRYYYRNFIHGLRNQ